VAEVQSVPMSYDEAVIRLIASRCTELESGGRMIDAILTNTMLPAISHEFLTRMMSGDPVSRLHVSAANDEFLYDFGGQGTVP
jgi:type VI secretion system protein VasG